MKITWSIKLIAACVLFAGVMTGCKKEDKVVTPPSQAHFNNKSSDVYFITAPGETKTITVGVTTVSDKDRTFNINVTSPTGATSGTQYTLSKNTITIPACKATDSFEVRGVYSEYTTGRKDTLVFTIQSGNEVPASDYNNTMTLLMRGPCFNGDVTLSEMGGTYANTFENGGSYGPYTATISNVTVLTPTTGTAKIDNLYDYFGPLTINFDWTDPANIKAEIPLQQTNQNYAAGQPFLVRTSPGQVSTFSVCSQTISLTIDVIVNNYPAPGSAAYYDQNYDVVLGR